MQEYNDTRKIEDLDPRVLAEAIEIARKLQANASDGSIISEDITKHKGILAKLLEYLILNQNNPNMDLSLIQFLEKALGITKSKKKDKELSEEQKKIRYQQIMYEAYKILNPERIAGETSLENFLSNVITRGIEVAREYDGAQYENNFSKKEIQDLDSNKESFVDKLKSSGHKGAGRGL